MKTISNKFSKTKTISVSKSLLLVSLFSFSFIACDNDDDPIPPPVNEEELITTVNAVFTPVGGGTAITLSYKDLDGEGSGAPVVTVSGKFAQNKTYNGEVEFLNESVNPVEDITEEIIEEALDHQVFYQKTGSLPSFVYSTDATNLDSNGKPIGLKVVFTTTTAASGDLKIILKHLPNKTAVGVATGDMTNAGGSTDAEATFAIQVE
jgi:hypothetical protein